jgi:predicted nuclease with TOPRIM domain
MSDLSSVAGVKRMRVQYGGAENTQLIKCLRANAKKVSELIGFIAEGLDKVNGQEDSQTRIQMMAKEMCKEKDEKILELEARLKEMKDEFECQMEEERVRVRQLMIECNDLELQLDAVHDELKTNQFQLGQANSMLDEYKTMQANSEEANVMLQAARQQFTDPITTENRGCILLTTGQLMDLEGLIRTWLAADDFTGDVWFPIKCPITKRITHPVREMGE